MDEYYSIFFSLAGSLIIILLGIIGFFLRQQITVIETLTETVHALKTSMEVVRTNEINLKTSCELKHTVIDRRFAAYETRIDKNETASETNHVSIENLKTTWGLQSNVIDRRLDALDKRNDKVEMMLGQLQALVNTKRTKNSRQDIDTNNLLNDY